MFPIQLHLNRSLDRRLLANVKMTSKSGRSTRTGLRWNSCWNVLIILNPPSENADWSHGVKGTWRTTATSPQVVAGSQVFLSLSPFSSFSYWSLKGLTWGGSIRTSSWSRWRTKMTKRTKWMQQWQNMLGSLIESNLTDFGEKRTKTYCKKGIKGSGTGSTPGLWGQRDPKKSRSRSWTRKSSSKGICFFPWVSMAQYKPLPFYGL